MQQKLITEHTVHIISYGELTLNESVIPNNDATVSETINLPLAPVSNKKLNFKESIRTDMEICELSVINIFAGSVVDTSG